MTGEIILGICPKCSHLFFEQPFPDACPSCGTHAPPMDPEVAAERHKARKAGATLDPIVAPPTRDSQIGEMFQDGLSKLRHIMAEERALLNKMEDDLEQAKKDPAISAEVHKMIEVKVGDQERRVRALYEAEKGVSVALALEGSERRKPHRQKFDHHEFISGDMEQWKRMVNVDGTSADEVTYDEFQRLRERFADLSRERLAHHFTGVSPDPERGVPPKPWAGGPCPACGQGTLEWGMNYMEFMEVLSCPQCLTTFSKRTPRGPAFTPDPLSEGGEP